MISSKPGTTREIYLLTISIMSLFSIYPDAMAMSRMAEAKVHSEDGIPCFSVSEKEEKRNGTPRLYALVLSDVSTKPATKVWSFIMPVGASIPVTADHCILYGVAPAGAEAIQAPQLIFGHMYDVFLNGRPEDRADPTRGYVGKFCMARKLSGATAVVPIGRNSKAWINELCPH